MTPAGSPEMTALAIVSSNVSVRESVVPRVKLPRFVEFVCDGASTSAGAFTVIPTVV